MNNAIKYIEDNASSIKDLGMKMFKTPELGYKEFKTKQILKEYFEANDLKIENESAVTGFTVSVGSGKPVIGLVAELDALPTLGHPFADPNDLNAAHSCGHSTQSTIMATALVALSKMNLTNGTVKVYFCPAEEYTDLDYRKNLIKQGVIDYIGGKENMIKDNIFDDADLLIHLHTSSSPKHFSLRSRQGGFLYKKITFNGKAAHAAVAPDKGVNALNMYALFNSGLNMLRETFVDDDHLRVHGFISEGGQTINSIPERVVYECYIRSINSDAIFSTSAKIDNLAKHVGLALGGSADVENMPGYLPLTQNESLVQVIYNNMLNYVDASNIDADEGISMAASDLGDLSMFKPLIQFGYGGFAGVCHSRELMVEDQDRVFVETPKLVVDTVLDLLNSPNYVDSIKTEFVQKMTKEEYFKYLSGK